MYFSISFLIGKVTNEAWLIQLKKSCMAPSVSFLCAAYLCCRCFFLWSILLVDLIFFSELILVTCVCTYLRHTSFPRIQTKKKYGRVDCRFYSLPKDCLHTQISCYIGYWIFMLFTPSHIYIEMTANGGQVKSPSFMLSSQAGAFRWYKMAFWVPFALLTNKILHDLVLKLETAVKQIPGIM